jgi:cupin fold WbuC family metalloprotein
MKQITLSDMQQQSEAAASAPRLRAHRNFHPELSDPVQRLAIAMEPGTYIRPHRHRHTFELLLPLKGRFVVLNFDDHGVVTNRVVLGETCTALEMEAGTWHTVLSLDAGGMVFEVKQGAYQPLAEIDTMAWAPAEGQPGTAEMMAWYAIAQPGDRFYAAITTATQTDAAGVCLPCRPQSLPIDRPFLRAPLILAFNIPAKKTGRNAYIQQTIFLYE